ncbi:helix-turn-helix domain-containing protein [Olsenella phocaeensis]|uniref:helix-turn-helix domain-containing protein n=1 Tax=Olsenella phocaeensis TaxID=1852385 RepID=UPI003A8DD197
MSGEGSARKLANFGDLLTVDEMAAVLDSSKRTVYRLCDKDELPYVKVGRRLYFPKHEVADKLRLVEVV